MDKNLNVIEAHLSTGKTLPLRTAQTKKGEQLWAVLDVRPSGEKYFNGWGPKVAKSVIGGNVKALSSITVDSIGTIKVKHDLSPKGQARATAMKSFTSPVDKEQWTLTFRATELDDETINLVVKLQKGSVSRTRVLTEL
jgi:hypothetical protein